MAENYRIEKDSMGELEVPNEALYGAQTQRAINNFPISGLTLPPAFIKTIALIKKTAAKVNMDLGELEPADRSCHYSGRATNNGRTASTPVSC